MSVCPPEPPSFLIAVNPLLYALQKNIYDTCMKQAQELPPPIIPPSLSPYIFGGMLTAGVVGISLIVADAYKNKKIITEVWNNKPAMPGYERAGKLRKYIKDWYARHKKDFKKIGGLGLLGFLVLLLAQYENMGEEDYNNLLKKMGQGRYISP